MLIDNHNIECKKIILHIRSKFRISKQIFTVVCVYVIIIIQWL